MLAQLTQAIKVLFVKPVKIQTVEDVTIEHQSPAVAQSPAQELEQRRGIAIVGTKM
jgi:hypothetical protein